MRAFSFGGGVQSTAALVLAAQGRIDYKLFLFANVGEDSENPDTLMYVENHAIQYALDNKLGFVELTRQTNNGETLYQRVIRDTKNMSIAHIEIPIRMSAGQPGARGCTMNYKVSVIRKWLGKGNHTVGLGISLDEFQRMRDSGHKRFTNHYPLIDLKLTRADCLKIIRDAGLPKPPKSSCWFCPFHNMSAWQDLKRNKPDLFDKAVDLENMLNEKRAAIGRDPVWLTGKARPLAQVIADQPLLIPETDDNCESGYCMV